MLKADSAKPVAGGWELTNARRFIRRSGTLEPLGTITAMKGVGTDQFTLAQVDGDELPHASLIHPLAEPEIAIRLASDLQ